MIALHDDNRAMETQEGAKIARAPWRRPSMRTVSARDAEVGAVVIHTDGAFTTS